MFSLLRQQTDGPERSPLALRHMRFTLTLHWTAVLQVPSQGNSSWRVDSCEGGICTNDIRLPNRIEIDILNRPCEARVPGRVRV